MDVFHRDFLLALATVTIERFEQHGVRPGKLVGLAQVLASPLKRLLAKSFFHCPVGTSPDPEELRRVQQLTTEAPMARSEKRLATFPLSAAIGAFPLVSAGVWHSPHPA
jgi:hypothetical protein